MVEFTFPLPDGRAAKLVRSVITGSSRMSIGDENVARSNGPDRPFLVPLAHGGTANVVVRGRGYDYAPQVFVDGHEIEVARKLSAWEYALAALPLLLIFVATFVGAVVGFAAMALNQWLLRRSWPYAARAGATLGVTVLALVVSIVIALAVEATLPARAS